MAYDLENRTFIFARDVRQFVKKVKLTVLNLDDIKQLLRSSGSVGANYIEANEATSQKDFYYRIKIARKEAKESTYWLRLLEGNIAPEYSGDIELFKKEGMELVKIFSSILKSSKEP